VSKMLAVSDDKSLLDVLRHNLHKEGCDYGGTTGTVAVRVRSLRRKIEDNPVKPACLGTWHWLLV
jgi:DNA-binding response OmpR family regulator